METPSSFFHHLKCRECGRLYPKKAIHICEFDFGPLEVVYDYEAIRHALTRSTLATRPHNMWRYRELFPLDHPPTVGFQVGFTPLIPAPRLAQALGVEELYLKNDTVNYPTLSFKDRVVSVALSRAKELGYSVVACASTGNLANAVAAHAASAGLKSYVLIPANLEKSKIINSQVYGTQLIGIQGAYDQVNRLCSEIADKYPWGFVNVNLRPYYAEGSKSMGFEIVEQLGWRFPQHTLVPMASGSLLTKIHKAYQECVHVGLMPPHEPSSPSNPHPYTLHGAQASGCSPISTAFKKGYELVKPISHPQTLVKSLAIGTPADGYYALRTLKETGGYAEDCTDTEVIAGIRLLAQTEGIFAETAGGTTVACAQKLIAAGKIPREESIVLCITGHGLKTQEVLHDQCGEPTVIEPSLREFEALIQRLEKA